MTTGPHLRATGGGRIAFAELPAALRTQIDDVLGSPVVSAATQTGGFSAGAAARVVAADGSRAFVKAVSDAVNPQTPGLFRHEAAVLSCLPPARHRANLLRTCEDGAWFALVLDDVEGRHPDLDDDRDMAALRDAVAAQSRELTPDPVRLDGPGMAETAQRWHCRIERSLDDDPSMFPEWLLAQRDDVLARTGSLADRMPASSWVHLDIRDDNLLVRPDGSGVTVDWGMSRSGPSWIDQVLLAVHRATSPSFDDLAADVVALAPGEPSGSLLQDAITDLVLSLGASLAALRDRPMPGLPGIDEFRQREQARLLECARRRLGA